MHQNIFPLETHRKNAATFPLFDKSSQGTFQIRKPSKLGGQVLDDAQAKGIYSTC